MKTLYKGWKEESGVYRHDKLKPFVYSIPILAANEATSVGTRSNMGDIVALYKKLERDGVNCIASWGVGGDNGSANKMRQQIKLMRDSANGGCPRQDHAKLFTIEGELHHRMQSPSVTFNDFYSIECFPR